MRKGTTALHTVTPTAMDRSISVSGDSLWQRDAGWRKIRPARLRARELSLTKTFQLFVHIFHFEKDSFAVKSKNLEVLGRKGVGSSHHNQGLLSACKLLESQTLFLHHVPLQIQPLEDFKIKTIIEIERESSGCNSNSGYSMVLPTWSPVVINKCDQYIVI